MLPFQILMMVTKNNKFVALIFTLIELLVIPVFTTGTFLYMIKFVKGQKQELKDVWSFFPQMFTIFTTSFLVALACFLGTLLLIVSGIILGIGLSFVQYILADPEYNLKNDSALRESWRLTKGYKMDVFVFELSFIGWGLLTVLTAGIAGIYTVPYMSTAHILYYEKLKEIQSNKKEV